jgi:hypothetical protein
MKKRERERDIFSIHKKSSRGNNVEKESLEGSI